MSGGSSARRRGRGIAVFVALAAVGLVLHARSFDSVCDDAFISLRHAQNLARHGAPVYNLGERVEGYSSPVWMLASAGLLRMGMEGRSALSFLGALGGVALIACVWRLWKQLVPDEPIRGLLVLALVAGSTPIAAWTSSGLETPLFAGLTALVIAEVAACAEAPTRRRALIAGLVVALAALTRPEGILLGAIALGWLAVQRRTRPAVLPFCLAAAIPLVAFELWRFHYYGALLPNTYAAKVSAGVRERVDNGLGYAWFTVTELGAVLCALLIAGLVAPTRARTPWLVRAAVASFVVYVVYVGGDFLDLFRFFVPILPLSYVALVASALALSDRWRAGTRGWVLAVALATLAFAQAQLGSRRRALQPDEPSRIARGIEPLGWTRGAAAFWADAGRYLKAHARPGDTMATAAAGATPYYAELPNLDLLGLADAEVARRGHLKGARPGHQRVATLEHVLRVRPTFLMLHECELPAHWSGWNWAEAGYECVVTRAPSSSGEPVRLTFLALRQRAAELERADF